MYNNARRPKYAEYWSMKIVFLSNEELGTLISILYVRWALGAEKQSVDSLWSNTCADRFFSVKIPSEKFKEILKFTSFEKKIKLFQTFAS